jgi:hypothetical protein
VALSPPIILPDALETALQNKEYIENPDRKRVPKKDKSKIRVQTEKMRGGPII